MKIKITNLTAELNDNRSLEELVAERLKISVKKIRSVKIIRKAVDARRFHGAGIKFNYIVEVETEKINLPRDKNIVKVERWKDGKVESFLIPNSTTSKNPVVIGFGPAGMFAALTLAMAGIHELKQLKNFLLAVNSIKIQMCSLAKAAQELFLTAN